MRRKADRPLTLNSLRKKNHAQKTHSALQRGLSAIRRESLLSLTCVEAEVQLTPAKTGDNRVIRDEMETKRKRY